MLTRFISRPHFLYPFAFFSPTSPLFSKPLSISLISASADASLSTTFDQTLPYGPSLHKGHQPLSEPSIVEYNSESDEDVLLDEDSFTRVFDIAALRVPSDRCSSLENRLRGHLLNWPRIRNIARVTGDEIEAEFKDFVKHETTSRINECDTGGLVSLNRRLFGKAEGDGETLNPILYRDKLAKSFNSTGYAHFRNLAKMSRPKKRKEKEEQEGRENKGIGRNGLYLVEVVDDESELEGDLSGLLGNEFKGRKWQGSTRLLLMDEQYAKKSMEEMPGAIKILETLLPKGIIVPSAFETVGHIAHLNLRDEHLPYKKLIAKVVLDKHKPKIQTVVNKINAIHNDYRTMQLEVLAGNHSLVTTLTENGLRFHVDLATVYWNSKLATERQRLLSGFRQNDVVCDVFAGVGPIAISAARTVKHVYANDLNPQAVDYLERNCVLNKIERKIEVFNMDGRRFIDAMFTSQRARPITQVVMNLPKDAVEYLDAFRGIYRETPMDREFTLPRIHVYGFSKARDPEFDFHERIRIALAEVAFEVEMHRVRLVAPGKWMLCASFILPERVAFAKPMFS